MSITIWGIKTRASAWSLYLNITIELNSSDPRNRTSDIIILLNKTQWLASSKWQDDISDKFIYPIYNELDLRRTVSYLGGIDSELLSLNKIARIPYGSQQPVLERTDIN